MGSGTLTNRSSGETILASFYNDIHNALNGDLVGRNSGGIATSGQNLGSIALPWGTLNVDNINIGGSALDTSTITSIANRVISGSERTESSFPDFLRPNGAALELNVNGATTTLAVSISGAVVNVTTDITKTGLSAAPATNNTALATLAAADANNKYVGEDESEITINTVGTEISSLVGTTVAFKTTNNEYFKCFVKDATTLSRAFRGYFLDSTGAAVERANLSNGDTLTLMKLGWIFIENNGTTVDVTYTEPSMTFAAPSSPATGDYWLDLTTQVWKRYTGSVWDIINRTFIGEFISDATNTVAVRPADYEKGAKELSNIELEISTVSIIKTKNDRLTLNVYGTDIDIITNGFSWNITTDLDTGSEAADTLYYLYISDKGEPLMSIQKPFKRNDLEGWYHPHQSWRSVGATFNDSGSDLVTVADYISSNFILTASSGTFTHNTGSSVIITNMEIILIYLDKTKVLKTGLTAESSSSSYIGSDDGSLGIFDLKVDATVGAATVDLLGSSGGHRIPPNSLNWLLDNDFFTTSKHWYEISIKVAKAGAGTGVKIFNAKMFSKMD